MAKFNDQIVIDCEQTQKECGMYLQSCLTNKELKELKDQWKKAGGYQVIPWWKFAFNTIKVSL